MIVVTGSTGKVGGGAVRGIAAAGVPVRALLRDPARAPGDWPERVDPVVGDLGDPGSLDRALDGADVLVLVSPGDPEQEGNAIDAARRAGVGSVLYLTSASSPDSPIARRRWHFRSEQRLASSGLPFVLLRPNAFMQNLLALAPAIRSTGGFRSSAAHGRIGLVDVRDVGAVAAAVALDPAPHLGADLRLTGPEAIGYDEVARVLSELLGRPVGYGAIGFEEDRDGMVAAGVPEAVATMNAQAFTLIAGGDADWTSGDVARVLGRPPRSFRDFAADHLEAFR